MSAPAPDLTAGLAGPLAVAMWDFSWLERRWPGGGYDDWDAALDGLVERGYDAVRIDAYPHLHAAGPDEAWTLVPRWPEHDWGSPHPVPARVRSALHDFVARCRERGVRVVLSTWFREDSGDMRMSVTTPERHAEAWASVLSDLSAACLLDAVWFVDLCNEFPHPLWLPGLYGSTGARPLPHNAPAAARWLHRTIGLLRAQWPGLPLTVSFTDLDTPDWPAVDVGSLDLLDLHLWMSEFSDFVGQVRAGAPGADEYEALARHGERVYREDTARWEAAQRRAVRLAADWSERSGLPLVTTEGWALVNYKDDARLPWDWVKESCAAGVREAAATGRWAGLATSNFCGPQFRGMWDDVGWHRELTDGIHAAALPPPAPER